MSAANPYAQLQADLAARLAESATLAAIPTFIEDLGEISDRLEKALAGLKAGTTSKSGLSLGLLTPAGRNGDETVTGAEFTTLRVSVWCKPLVNAGANGFQIHPLTILFELRKYVGEWDRGPGLPPPKFLAWDSLEDKARGIVNYFADFEVYQILNLT